MSRLCWQFALTAEALALDASIALELILMITNTQTLGVPIRFAAVGGSFSALCGFLFIPVLGFITDRLAKSKTSKAKILVFTAFIELIGVLCVFTANALKLFSEEHNSSGQRLQPYAIHSSGSLTSEGPRLASDVRYLDQSFLSSSSINITTKYTNSLATWRLARANENMFRNSTVSKGLETSFQSNFTLHDSDISTNAVPFYAYIAIFGYCCTDAGYDFGGCFLKTFILHCTPSDQHVNVLMNLILISSVGGVITSVLGSFDVGTLLTAGTHYDSNAALAFVVSAVCGSLVLLGTGVTLVTAFCWKPPSKTCSHTISDEKSVLISCSDARTNCSEYANGTIHSSDTTNGTMKTNGEANSGHHCTVHEKLRGGGIISFFHSHKKQIQVNIFAFGAMGAVTCFGLYGTNFAGTGIFQGDPAAPSGSEKYQRFLDGVTVGYRGTLLYFVVFAIFSFFHQKSLQCLGWKRETILVTLTYFILCVALALSKNVYVFYVTSVGTGFIRTIAMTVPYILAHRISAEKNGGASSGTAISLIAASLPCGVFICTVIMGPLIEATGDPGVSILYAGVCSALACVFARVLDI